MTSLYMLRRQERENRMRAQDGKQLIIQFESIKNMAELRALSKHSLENVLTSEQYERLMELKQICLGGMQ